MLELSIEKDLGRFSLSVQLQADKERVALLGASGSGKSMTLQCIAGIVSPDRGRIVLDGQVLFDAQKHIHLCPQKRQIGYLFQNYALFPQKTVLENVLLGMYRLPVSRREKRERAEAMLARMQLTALSARFPAQLSGGQQQRTAIARMLVSEPRILMLDEPFSALDSHLRWEMEQVISEVLRSYEGTSFVVTHDRDEAYRLCDSIAIIEQGKITMHADKQTVFRAPQTREAARLTGCKNCTDAQKTGAYTLYAPAWNLHLTAAAPLPETLSAVGLRAHFFVPNGTENPFSAVIVQRIDSPFSTIYMVRSQGAAALLRWESDTLRDLTIGTALTLSIAADAVLPLH